MKKPLPLRERKKLATRLALVAAAHRSFHSVGFEATTIEALCAEVSISKRTYFRYFADKEALAFPHRQERLERFISLLQASPVNENPFTSLRRIARLFAQEYMQHREQLLAQQGLIQSSPALRAREHEIDRDWELAMAQTFRNRISGGPEAELRARVLAGAAIGVIRATMRHWFEHGAQADLKSLGFEALDCLERGFSSGSL